MITKNQIKLIRSLSKKKIRKKLKLFVAEGSKVVDELLASNLELDSIYSIENKYEGYDCFFKTSSEKLSMISNLKTPNNVLAVFKIPKLKDIDFTNNIIALENISDPGNLGSIIRLCDWFGIQDLICSLDTVDCYNPKVIQATMGSISRVNITYSDFNFLIKKSKNLVLADLKGEPLKNYNFKKNQIIFFGNESEGISNHLKKVVSDSITIKKYGDKIDSLNVANSVGIVLSHLKN
jgi:TrmH family RNA methyltransferase